MAVSAIAAPAPTSETTFSFAQWVEDIIAHPNTALTAEEAVAAAHAANIVGTAGGLHKRARCDQPSKKAAPGRDAAACIEDLARKGAQGTMCIIPQEKFMIQMYTIRGAKIVASTGLSVAQATNCQNFARTGGLIFDSCWQVDDTIKGSEILPTDQGHLQVNIAGIQGWC